MLRFEMPTPYPTPYPTLKDGTGTINHAGARNTAPVLPPYPQLRARRGTHRCERAALPTSSHIEESPLYKDPNPGSPTDTTW